MGLGKKKIGGRKGRRRAGVKKKEEERGLVDSREWWNADGGTDEVLG